ncbi:MAG TPA: GDSL-type esterase/lipase family protein [Nocardioides sp.]|nr:GDSL-type esterase/lipase family protein [uncultured Nocardioides sp.]HEX5988261.1 GDSL-type esterase/lipase family protein [Nocardioides sp.]
MEPSDERLVVGLGDSVTAGDGLRGPDETVTARLAERLDASWVVRARSGLTSRGIARLLERQVAAGDVAAADVVVVSVGVNDLLRLKPLVLWRRDLSVLLNRVTSLTSGRVVLLGMPPVRAFPRLPRAVAVPLGARAARMDRVGVDVARRYGVLHLPLPATLLEPAGAFADDGFHPSAQSHDVLARLIAELLSSTWAR